MPGPILSTLAQVDWIEPIWKMLWSSKALLAVLWEMFPDHAYLLPAYLDGPHGVSDFVKKPLLSREGAKVTVHAGRKTFSTDGPYGGEGFVYQALAPGWSADRETPVI